MLHGLYECECWDTKRNNAVLVLQENVFNENTAELGGAVSVGFGKSKIIGNVISDEQERESDDILYHNL